MDEAEITGLAKCKYTKSGNVVTWNATKFSMKHVTTNSISDSTLFCINKRQYLVIPEILTFNAAMEKCTSLGGTITVPLTKAENSEIYGLFDEHQEKCLVNDGADKYTWLGLQKPGLSWYENLINGTTRLIDYFNWNGTLNSMYRFSNLCAFMYTDGTWGYEKMGTCQSMSMCTICYFTTIPMYILKGRYQRTPEIERTYYMSINSTHQVAAFNGVRKRTNLFQNPNKKWIIKESINGKNQLLLEDTRVPIGRHNWSYVQPTDTTGEQLTLSLCKVGNEYTCNFG